MSRLEYFFEKYLPSERLLYVIRFLRLLFGNYISISNSRLNCFLLRLYCIGFCFIDVTVYLYYDFKIGEVNFPIFWMLQNTLIVIVNLIYGDGQFIKFFNAIRTNDRLMGFKKFSLIRDYMYLIIIGNSVFRICYSTYRFFQIRETSGLEGFFSICVAVLSLDLNNSIIIIIFSILHSRMKQLRIFLESNFVPVNIVGKDDIAVSVKNVRKSLFNYNSLLDNMQYVHQQVQLLLIISWSVTSARIIVLSYHMVKSYLSVVTFIHVMATLTELVQIVFIMFCPPVIVEATIYEVDQIKQTLTTQLLRTSDESLRFELETALLYVSLRPFSYSICRAVTLNIKLPFIIISLCITYVIVIMQLTHFIT